MVSKSKSLSSSAQSARPEGDEMDGRRLSDREAHRAPLRTQSPMRNVMGKSLCGDPAAMKG